GIPAFELAHAAVDPDEEDLLGLFFHLFRRSGMKQVRQAERCADPCRRAEKLAAGKSVFPGFAERIHVSGSCKTHSTPAGTRAGCESPFHDSRHVSPDSRRCPFSLPRSAGA